MNRLNVKGSTKQFGQVMLISYSCSFDPSDIDGYMDIIIETPIAYQQIILHYINNKIEKGVMYPKETYGDREKFAAIFGKFDPYVSIFETPIIFEQLDYVDIILYFYNIEKNLPPSPSFPDGDA